ncbi:amidase family protein (plasmid) [Nocardioides sp. R1-1]|uniref:amidase family protein n=1 Tax=Nocardioides sp. R1-1 TaxID=3383502 RepID=UPI0038CFF687
MQRPRTAGAIPVAKSATPEFAINSSIHSPGYGVTRNPWNPACRRRRSNAGGPRGA